MNRSLLRILLIGGILCIGLGIYFGFIKSAPTTSVPTQSVKISPDNKTATVVVPANAAYGINAIDASTGKQFVINPGEDIEISVSGNVQVGTDRPVVGPEGETTGYFDTGVDSPYSRNVGGLEMWIGPNRGSQHYLLGSNVRQRFPEGGVPTFRIIDKLPMRMASGKMEGYQGTGAFTVTITKR